MPVAIIVVFGKACYSRDVTKVVDISRFHFVLNAHTNQLWTLLDVATSPLIVRHCLLN